MLNPIATRTGTLCTDYILVYSYSLLVIFSLYILLPVHVHVDYTIVENEALDLPSEYA